MFLNLSKKIAQKIILRMNTEQILYAIYIFADELYYRYPTPENSPTARKILQAIIDHNKNS